MVEAARSGGDGTFRLTSTPLVPGPVERPNPARLVLVAEHPGHAVGWKTVASGPSFSGEIRLGDQMIARTIAVTDGAGQPLAGATVAVMFLGDVSSPTPEFRDPLELKAGEGPLAAITDAAGQARFPTLPPTKASFAASKPGYAETICFPEQDKIRLTPAASLEGTLTGPAGQPLGGVQIKLKTEFMWDYELGTTDERGRYRFDQLKAHGWDMAAWRAGQVADGQYKLWIENPKFAIPTQTFVLEPNERRTLNLEAEPTGVIRIKVVEAGTRKLIPGVRVWGLSASGGRFDANTDAEGVATFHSLASKITLSIASPPKGTFTDANLMDPWSKDTAVALDFLGGAETATLILPRIGGQLVPVRGKCARPDGTLAPEVTVHATSNTRNASIHSRRVEDAGEFTLEGVPAGRNLGVCALSDDGKTGGWVASQVSPAGQPEPPIHLVLQPTTTAEFLLTDDQGNPLSSQDFYVTPKVASEFRNLNRFVRTDEQGRVRLDRIIPGLTYHVGRIARGLAYQVEASPTPRPLPAGGKAEPGIVIDTDVILSPPG